MSPEGPPAPLPGPALLQLLVALAVLLLLARVLGRLGERVGLPVIVGELCTGVVLGPSLLGWLAPGLAGLVVPQQAGGMHLLDAVGQLGLLLLVFFAGTHLDPAAVRRHGRAAVAVSLGGLLVPLAAGIGVGIALAPALSGSAPTATMLFPLFLGVAMCVTAIPVIAKTLTDMNLMHRTVAQLTLVAGMVDDAVGWLLLSVLAAAATTGVVAGQIALSVAAMAGVVLVAAVIGRRVVARIMQRAGRAATSAPTVAAAVVLVLLAAAGTHALHLEAIFGAFLAGVLVAGTGPAVLARLAPLRTVTLAVLAPVFLASAGLRMDLTALADPGVALAALVVLAMAVLGKFGGAFLGARVAGRSTWEGLALGAGMNARGVVEVVVALTGLRLGVINTAGYTVVVLVAVLTSVMAPPLLRWSLRRVELDDEERSREAEQAAWSAEPIATGTRGQAPARAGSIEKAVSTEKTVSTGRTVSIE